MDALAESTDGYKKYLRRKFAGNLPALTARADELAACADEVVTITQQSFEGGSHAGQITMPRLVALNLVEDLIAEMSTTAPRPCNTAVAYFR